MALIKVGRTTINTDYLVYCDDCEQEPDRKLVVQMFTGDTDSQKGQLEFGDIDAEALRAYLKKNAQDIVAELNTGDQSGAEGGEGNGNGNSTGNTDNTATDPNAAKVPENG